MREHIFLLKLINLTQIALIFHLPKGSNKKLDILWVLQSQNVLAEEKWIWTHVIYWSGKGIRVQVQITVKWEGPKYSALVSLYKVSSKLFGLFYTFITYSITIRSKQTRSGGFMCEKHPRQPKGRREQSKWSEDLLHQGATDQQYNQ